ncbi:MAG: hypothetical protein ACR5KW_00445 [Wolbachia sp.]
MEFKIKKIVIQALVFKSGTDDVRNSSAIDIAKLLANSKVIKFLHMNSVENRYATQLSL